MADWKHYQERLPTALTSADVSPSTSAASPALSEESQASHRSTESPPTSVEGHEPPKERAQHEQEKLVTPLPPLEHGASSRSTTDRPLRHLGLNPRLSERGTSSFTEEDELFSPRSEQEAEDPFSMSSEVSRSERIKGRLTTLLGKVTRNPSKILEGEVRSNGAHLALRSEGRSEIE